MIYKSVNWRTRKTSDVIQSKSEGPVTWGTNGVSTSLSLKAWELGVSGVMVPFQI